MGGGIVSAIYGGATAASGWAGGGNHQDGSSESSAGGSSRSGSRSPLSFYDSDRGGSSGRTTPRLREIVVIGESGRSTGASGGDSRPNSRGNSRRPSLASSYDGSDAEYYSAEEGGMKRSASRGSDLGKLPRSVLKVTISQDTSPGEYHGARTGTGGARGGGGKQRDGDSVSKNKKKTPTMADELPTPVTRMLLTVLFERFDRNGNSSIDCDEFQRLISSCNMRRGKRRRPRRNDVLPLLRALDQDGDGSIQLDEFEGWVTKGFHMSLQQLSTFAEKGTTEAMLVDFLLALRADVKGILRRVASLIERYSTDGSDRTLDYAGFASMCRARAHTREETVSTSEVATFLRAMGYEEYIRREDLRTLLCRGVINRGLSIVGRGQQRHRRVWVLIRKCGFYITDGEIDQLDMDDEDEGYYDGEGEGGGDESYGEDEDDDGGDEDGGNEYGYGATRSGNKDERRHRQRRRRRSQGRTSKTGRKKSSSKVRPRAENLPMDPPRAQAGENWDEYATAGAADKVDVIRGISSMSTSTVSFRSDDGVLPRLGNSSSLSGSGSAAGRSRPPKVDTSISARGGVGDLSHQQGLPVTPLLGKGALQQQNGRHALPPPLRQPSLPGSSGSSNNRIDVTPLQSSSRKRHFRPPGGGQPVPPPLNPGRKLRK